MDRALRISRTWLAVLLVTVLVFLSEWIQSLGWIFIPSGARHTAILGLFAFTWWLAHGKRTVGRGYRTGVVLLGAYLAAAYLFVPVALFNYVLGTVFTFLFVALFALGSSTRTNPNVVISIFKGLLAFFVLMSVGPILQGLSAGTTLRYLPGIFRELGAFGAAMNIGTILCLALYIMTRKQVYLYIAGFFTFGVLLTILKKSIVENLIVWLVFVVMHTTGKRRRRIVVVSAVGFAVGFSVVGAELMANFTQNADYLANVGNEGHVRIGMFIASFRIASDYFPFGSGMGTFGSLASIVGRYSQVYHDYGASLLGSNSPEAVAAGHHTLFDTFWPHILGELGFLGSLLFLFFWLYPARLGFSLMRSSSDPVIKGFSFYIVLIVVMMSAEGFTLFTPEIPSFIILHSGVAGMAYYHLVQDRRLHPPPVAPLRKRAWLARLAKRPANAI